MMRTAVSDRIGYFGKIPARSDFVKVAHDVPVMGMLDEWLAQVMSSLPSNPRWKLDYDALTPLSFGFVGPARHHAVAGHLVASHDQSGRRFPFLMTRTLEVAEPVSFVPRSPLAFAPLWDYFDAMTRKVVGSTDPGPQLQAVVEANVALGECDAALASFLAGGTVASLSGALGMPAERLILAIGLLLQPVMHSKPSALHKSLVLPLPEAASQRCAVAAFWLELVTPFLRRGRFDLALFITRQDERPVLVVGFCSAVAETLRAIIDPLVAREQQVGFANTTWVDEQLGLDVDVRALASYLDQPQLPLRLARELFLKTFIGAAS
jgi:type VI secretion system protein ImpM